MARPRRLSELDRRLALVAGELASGRRVEAPLPLLALAYLNGCGENIALKRLAARCPALGISFQVHERMAGSATTKIVIFSTSASA
jgi:hypothetical protein